MKKVRVLLADEQPLVRRGVRTLLQNRRDSDYCGEAYTIEGILNQVASKRPDLVILGHAQQDSPTLIRDIRGLLPSVEILVLSATYSEESVQRAVTSGARGYVLTTDPDVVLVKAMKNLAQHRPYFTGIALEFILRKFQGVDIDGIPGGVSMNHRLTLREREILALIVQAESNKRIASDLKISLRTVETHRARIMGKLGLHSVVELVRYAMANGLGRGPEPG